MVKKKKGKYEENLTGTDMYRYAKVTDILNVLYLVNSSVIYDASKYMKEYNLIFIKYIAYIKILCSHSYQLFCVDFWICAK